jgi:hypothetical protein
VGIVGMVRYGMFLLVGEDKKESVPFFSVSAYASASASAVVFVFVVL